MEHEPQPSSEALVADNSATILRMERESQGRRTLSERLSDRATAAFGSLGFVLLHLAVFAGWVVINLGLVPFLPVFDPFPFGIFTLFVSAEGVFLAIFILISQNHVRRQSDLRDHLNLQLSLLVEREVTHILRAIAELGTELGAGRPHPEARVLAEETRVTDLAEELKRQLPEGHTG